MRAPLTDLASISIGYQHRGELVTAATVGPYRLIQIKDIDREGRFLDQFAVPADHRLWTGSLYMVNPKGSVDAYAVQEGDVLFLSRGARYFAVPLVRPYVEPFPDSWDGIIAAYYFYILRPKAGKVSPEYFAWALNQTRLQTEMDAISQGSHMKMIGKTEFANLAIDVPPLATQRKIVEIHHLALKERRLTNQIQAKRELLVDMLCTRAAAGDR